MKFKIIETANPLATHGLFGTRAAAEKHLRDTIPTYVRMGFFADKTLVAESFSVVPSNPRD